jgi:hypothetical protein
MRRWYLPFKTIDPHEPGKKKWNVGVEEAHFNRLRHQGHEAPLARLKLVEEVLEGGITSIYQGWLRPGKEDCYVYVGSPDLDYKSLTITTPAPPNMAFLVFILPDGTIKDWTWRPLVDGENRPEGMGDLIWPPNAT